MANKLRQWKTACSRILSNTVSAETERGREARRACEGPIMGCGRVEAA
jgi:hypothetical protein